MRILIAAALLLGPITASAQVVENEIGWLQHFHEHRLDARWALTGDLQLRRSGRYAQDPQQAIARTGITYSVSPKVRVSGGYAYIGTSPYGDAPAAAHFPEHRLWQQLLLSETSGAIAWQGRFRLEQRWLGVTRTTPGGDWEVTDWTTRHRFRPMLRASVDATSLGIDAKPLYVTAWDELFLHVGEQVLGETLDQNRVSLQLGWRFSPRVRVEAGYISQFIKRGAPRVSEHNQGLIVTIWTVTGAP